MSRDRGDADFTPTSKDIDLPNQSGKDPTLARRLQQQTDLQLQTQSQPKKAAAPKQVAADKPAWNPIKRLGQTVGTFKSGGR